MQRGTSRDERKSQVVVIAIKAVTSQAWEPREPPQGQGRRSADIAKASVMLKIMTFHGIYQMTQKPVSKG